MSTCQFHGLYEGEKCGVCEAGGTVIISLDGLGVNKRGFNPVSLCVEFVENKMQLKGEKRREFDFYGFNVTEILFPRPDNEIANWYTLLWCLTPLEKAYIQEGELGFRKEFVNDKVGAMPNPLVHVSFQHTGEDTLNKSILVVEKSFQGALQTWIPLNLFSLQCCSSSLLS